jgi:hypothetical protein
MDPATAAVLGGLGGAAVTGIVAWLVALTQRRHERMLAREARRQARYEQTYVDVLEHAFLIADIVERTNPVLSISGDPGPPDFPDDGTIRRLNARTSVFASGAVRDGVRSLNQAVRVFQVASWQLDAERERPGMGGGSSADLWKALEDKRAEVRRHMATLIDLANAELDARTSNW